MRLLYTHPSLAEVFQARSELERQGIKCAMQHSQSGHLRDLLALREGEPLALHAVLPGFIPATRAVPPFPGDGLLTSLAGILLAVVP